MAKLLSSNSSLNRPRSLFWLICVCGESHSQAGFAGQIWSFDIFPPKVCLSKILGAGQLSKKTEVMKHWVKLGGSQSTWRMRQEEAMLVWQGGEPAHDCAATPGPPTACSSLLLLLPLQCILHKSSHCLLLATHYCTVHSAHCSAQCIGPPTALLLTPHYLYSVTAQVLPH